MATAASVPPPSDPSAYFSTLVSSLLSSLSSLLSSLPDLDLDHLKQSHRPSKEVYAVLAQPSATWAQLRIPLQVPRIVSSDSPTIANSIIGIEVFSMDGGDRWLGQACSEGGWQLVEIMMYFGKLKEGIANFGNRKGHRSALDVKNPFANGHSARSDALLKDSHQLPPLPIPSKPKTTAEKGVQTSREEKPSAVRATVASSASNEGPQLPKAPLAIGLPTTKTIEAIETMSLPTSPRPVSSDLPHRRNSRSISQPEIPLFTPTLSAPSIERETSAQLESPSTEASKTPPAASSTSENGSPRSLLPLPGFAPPKLPSSRPSRASPPTIASRRTWTRPGLTQEERQLAAQEIYIPSPRESVTNRPKRNRRLPNKVAEDGGLVDQDGRMIVGWEEIRKTQATIESRKRVKFERNQMAVSGDADNTDGGVGEMGHGEGQAGQKGELSDLKFGQTIFAKFPNYNWWPAVILDPSTAPPNSQGTRTTNSYLVKSIPTGADHRWIPADSSSIRLIEHSELDEIEKGTYPPDKYPPVSWKKWRGELVQAVRLIRNPVELKVWLENKTEAELWIEAEKERKAARRLSAQTQTESVENHQFEAPSTYSTPAPDQTD
ncbi:hypothetical protein JCM3765_003878 [Sporobolomyces pararoseus]